MENKKNGGEGREGKSKASGMDGMKKNEWDLYGTCMGYNGESQADLWNGERGRLGEEGKGGEREG